MSEMTATPPESDRTVQRRNQVLDAAAICFRNHGFHGASMAQISKTAGMSPGHIYHYFGSKEAIITAIVERDIEEMVEWTEIFYTSDNILQTMVDSVSCGIEANTQRDNAALMLEIFAESSRNPQIAATLQKSHAFGHQRLYDLLKKEMAQRGATSEFDVSVKVDLIAAMFDGLLLKSIHNPDLDKAALTRLMRQVMQFVLML
ncbi:TetR/AcrR family transcriptional regulator [Tolumonas osonensis]|uniref:AcrR family transcriptional regulator n=1 Tax=Tolumonas osonensis TaxID=675874 RepID=A0A841GH47_9GAMM|nr:TetR/AcrR family transcriptional regulator [Tolumonas osonensis]MBB6054581.1 AcrR family transcriptional regulator [Tolumonas osonensis]